MAQFKLAAGHPQGLMTLFFSEMWERFCYYGMRVLLTLFLVKSLLKGDADAALIYGAYTALIYAAPVLGGKMADQYLGYRYAILLGAVMMAIGEFLMVGGALGGPDSIATSEMLMLFGMGALIVGMLWWAPVLVMRWAGMASAYPVPAIWLHAWLMTEQELGRVQRQEAVSMLPVLALRVPPGASCLDLCASPG